MFGRPSLVCLLSIVMTFVWPAVLHSEELKGPIDGASGFPLARPYFLQSEMGLAELSIMGESGYPEGRNFDKDSTFEGSGRRRSHRTGLGRLAVPEPAAGDELLSSMPIMEHEFEDVQGKGHEGMDVVFGLRFSFKQFKLRGLYDSLLSRIKKSDTPGTKGSPSVSFYLDSPGF